MIQVTIHFLILSGFFFTNASAGILKSLDTDTLQQLSHKLAEIDSRLKDQKFSVHASTFEWKELDKFKEDVLFSVAHDPLGPKKKDESLNIDPVFLTQKLKSAWMGLEAQVSEMGELQNTEEWKSLDLEMEKFLKLRESFFYQPARGVIKSGLILEKMQAIKRLAASKTTESIRTRNIGIKVLDPVIERLNSELVVVSKNIHKLIQISAPEPKKPTTIFDEKLNLQLGVFSCLVILFSVISTFVAMRIYRNRSAIEEAKKAPDVKNGFNYYEWLKKFESSLHHMKRNDEDLSEYFVELRSMAQNLNTAYKNINIADGQQDYYMALEQLNEVAPRIEDYLTKKSPTKHAEASRKLIALVIQICEAIESKKEFNLDDKKPNLRLVKLEQTIHSKSA